MAQAVAVAVAVDNYLVFDELPDYEKGDKKIEILSVNELLASIKLQKEKKCHMYYGNDEIYIDELAGSEKTALFGTLTGRTTQGKTTYIVRKIGKPASLLYSTKELNLLLKKLTRTPIFSKLVASTGFENTQGSIYMSGVTTGNPTKDDAAAIRDQSISLDEKHLQAIRDVYNTKENVFFGLGGQTKTHPLRLYAKKVGTSEYKKVSFDNSQGPVSELFLNPIGEGTITEKKAARAKKLEEEIVANANEFAQLQKELAEYNTANSQTKKTCAKLSKVSEDALSENINLELKSVSDKKTDLAAKKAEGDAFLVREANFGEKKKINEFLKEYILIMSPTLWNVPGAPVAAAPTSTPAPEQTGATVQGIVQKEERWATDPRGWVGMGGKRRTKRNNKKSHKQGKSKKQNKSRRFFKGFMY